MGIGTIAPKTTDESQTVKSQLGGSCDTLAGRTDIRQDIVVRRKPTEDDLKDFKSRLAYLVEVSGRTGGWIEKEEQRRATEEGRPSRLSSGEVWRMLNVEARGKRAGEDKIKAIAQLLGASEFFLGFGTSPDGRIFLDEPGPGEMRLRALEEKVEELTRRTPAPRARSSGQIRPTAGHIRPKK